MLQHSWHNPVYEQEETQAFANSRVSSFRCEHWNTTGDFSARIDIMKRFLPADALWNLALAINGSYFPTPLYLCSSQLGAPKFCLGTPVLSLKA